ncbi:MAG: endonuclease MutS2 [Candidatus Izimaplasma sp.]|nr:endonuclease MutS2 [Candidatus Izimaplasma bacterium]
MIADINKLEFDKIKNRLRSYAVTDLGKDSIKDLKPKANKNSINKELLEVETAKILIIRYDETPLTGVLDIRSIINKARIESVLTVNELMKIVSHQEALQRTNQYIKKVKALEIDITTLDDYYSRLVNLSDLKFKIDQVIDKKGDIYDNASATLSRIRNKIKTIEERIDSKMASLLKSEANKLSDSIITIRNNRLVLPVKAEFKNSFKGVIHDQSASKETVFIEPLSCSNLNNQLQSLLLDEENEIDKILRQLTLFVKDSVDNLQLNLDLFTYLDIVFAKAKYAVEFDFTRPNLTDKIKLIDAKHPMIDPEEVVGNNIFFGDYHHIIITGPNTGGKTVALKTLGLLAIMVQSGLLIPVKENSEIIVFDNIFADIGDEQSIEQSLSTFSSHIGNIIRILKNMSDNSLVLLDEIGSGTDPKEGASLAISIIDHIRNLKIYSMITTHYPELKTYAYNLSNTVNASVEFDLESLKPTYKLRIGVPGSSNAISIARRLGLNESVCKNAESVSLSFDTDVTKLINKLEKQSINLENQITEYENKIQELKLQDNRLNELKQKQKEDYNKRIKKLEEENVVKQKQALEKVNNLISELDELKSEAEFKEHKLAEIKHKSKNIIDIEQKYEKTTDHKISVGDRVKVLSYQRNGVVNKKLKEKEFEVQMGVLTVTAKEDELEYLGKNKVEHSKIKSEPIIAKNVKVELDLHGKRYVEAMEELDKFVDDCLLNNLEFAYIVHGIGTQALKKGVEKYAKNNSQIKNYRLGGENEGGKGVTIIYFK